MDSITLCEGVLGYSTFEPYTFSGIGTKGYSTSWATKNSGVGIGRGCDLAFQQSFTIKYIFRHLLRLEEKYISMLENTKVSEENLPNNSVFEEHINNTWITGVKGAAAKELAQNIKKAGFQLSTEQIFALFHATWTDAKCKAGKSRNQEKGIFRDIFSTIYPPLREILISLSHSGTGTDLVSQEINKKKSFSGGEPIQQCIDMYDIFEKATPKDGITSGRFTTRKLYADILLQTLKKGIKIEWISLADTYLVDVWKLPDNPASTQAEKQINWEPWANYNKGNVYDISLDNFNAMLRDRQNKTIEFASALSVGEKLLEAGNKIENIHYGYLQKEYNYNILGRITGQAIARELNKKLVLNPPLSLKNGLWNSSLIGAWHRFQKEKLGFNFATSYPDKFTMGMLFDEGFPFLSNTAGDDIITVHKQKLSSKHVYTPSKNRNFTITPSELQVLDKLHKKGGKADIVGSVGGNNRTSFAPQDNRPFDVLVIKILLCRHGLWRMDLSKFEGKQASFSVEVSTLAEDSFVQKIIEFNAIHQILDENKIPLNYITPNSDTLKKLNGE